MIAVEEWDVNAKTKEFKKNKVTSKRDGSKETLEHRTIIL